MSGDFTQPQARANLQQLTLCTGKLPTEHTFLHHVLPESLQDTSLGQSKYRLVTVLRKSKQPEAAFGEVPLESGVRREL